MNYFLNILCFKNKSTMKVYKIFLIFFDILKPKSAFLNLIRQHLKSLQLMLQFL